jgi:aminoglycoside 3-N-acetyltransferase I
MHTTQGKRLILINMNKRLTHNDLPLFRELIVLFAKEFDGKVMQESVLPNDEYLKRLLAKDDLHVVVALKNEKVIGGLTAYELEMYSKKGKEMYLYDLAVDEDHRRKGVARSLVDSLKEIAKYAGVSTIFVEANTEDIGAVEFYRSLGAEMEEVNHFNIHVI